MRRLWTEHSGALWENGRHKNSCRIFIDEIALFLDRHRIKAIDDAVIDRLVGYFREKGNRNSTINRKLAALFKLLKKAERAGQIARLPTYLRLRERNARVRFLTASEEAAMFAAIERRNPDHARLCRFLVDTGARVGEALALKWNDIHGDTVTFWITKSGRSRSVPLTRRARLALAAIRRSDPKGPFAAIAYQNFKYDWNKARVECGFAGDPNMVPHILRHTCASRLVQAGIDLRRVQTFLGHQTIQITIRYAHLATNDLDQCARALDALQEPKTAAAAVKLDYGKTG
ncbi:site-specific integrase [Pseudohoeflea sp. DP4N28-3]|uniref:tyrosine-type recombinase/integrase n=1 Tax=Pseudohoeflea coraliihabitans TaxID=2860393 RepID=UPI00210772BB|nr:site-specific integrase [Pseudohoeflea sp. DP4N28-3]